MRFTFAIAFCVLATSAFGGVMSTSYAGNYAGQLVQQAPTPVPRTAPSSAQAAAKDEKCWMETKKCCWVEKENGYECRDNYDTKMARCHKKYKFDKKCGKTKKRGQVEMPKGRVDYSRCEKVHYDPNYGPHVVGYPTGMSAVYHSKELPTAPYKVEAEPYAPPAASAATTSYEQKTANNGYHAQTPTREY